MDPEPGECALCLSISGSAGRAVFKMRLSTATPTALSVRWPNKLRARRRGPMMVL